MVPRGQGGRPHFTPLPEVGLPPNFSTGYVMIQNRRNFIAGSAIAAASLPLAACGKADMAEYDAAAAKLRETIARDPGMQDLVRYATLAPNGHNSQPWRFSINGNFASIIPDLSRRTPVVDPDDHHLFISLGCAAENLLIASAAHGRPGQMLFLNNEGGRIDIGLERGKADMSPLYDAIPKRQSTRSVYDGRAVSAENLKLLETASQIDGVSVLMIIDKQRKESVLEQVVAANTRQMDDPAFVQELKKWVRFNPEQALAKRDGLFGPASGNTTVPTFVGRTLFSQFLDTDTENKKYAEHIRSSPGIAVFVADKADKDHWVRVGRSFQRFGLQATALGLRLAHINQPVEDTKIRTQFARWLGMPGKRPDLVIRFGYAPSLPMSLRRSVHDILIPWEISR
jgi:hypothetical protein